jgi:hypothetical protein
VIGARATSSAPALEELHPDTDTTFEVKVINKTAQAHGFRLGYRETKVLPKGASQFFYYSFHVVGRTAWQVWHGTPQGAGQRGVFTVTLPEAFSGGAPG